MAGRVHTGNSVFRVDHCLSLAALVVLFSDPSRHLRRISIACAAAFLGVWIEKGMGLIIPGFIPSTLHEMVEYTPTLIGMRVSWGVWALGLIVLTVGLKIAAVIFSAAEVSGIHPVGSGDVSGVMPLPSYCSSEARLGCR